MSLIVGRLLLATALATVPDAATVTRVEAAFAPPAGAQPRAAYVRWYWSDPARPDVVDAVYLAPAIAAHFGADLRDPVRVVMSGEAPNIMDGGCGVVRVRSRPPYDRAEAVCGGR